jgi:hypothetical protein
LSPDTSRSNSRSQPGSAIQKEPDRNGPDPLGLGTDGLFSHLASSFHFLPFALLAFHFQLTHSPAYSALASQNPTSPAPSCCETLEAAAAAEDSLILSRDGGRQRRRRGRGSGGGAGRSGEAAGGAPGAARASAPRAQVGGGHGAGEAGDRGAPGEVLHVLRSRAVGSWVLQEGPAPV